MSEPRRPLAGRRIAEVLATSTGGVVLVVAAVVMMGTSRGPLRAAASGLRGSSASEVTGV